MSQRTTAPDGGLDPDQEALYATLSDHLRQIDAAYNAIFEALPTSREERLPGPELRRRLRCELGELVYDLKLLARSL